MTRYTKLAKKRSEHLDLLRRRIADFAAYEVQESEPIEKGRLTQVDLQLQAVIEALRHYDNYAQAHESSAGKGGK